MRVCMRAAHVRMRARVRVHVAPGMKGGLTRADPPPHTHTHTHTHTTTNNNNPYARHTPPCATVQIGPVNEALCVPPSARKRRRLLQFLGL